MGAKWNPDTIVAAFTDAAVDPAQWNAAMEVACKVTGSAGAALFSFHGSPIPMFPHTESLKPSVDTYLREGWIHRDERNKLWPKLKKNGVYVVTDLDYTTADDMALHPYYQEFLAPFGLRWYAAVKVACGDDLWALSMQHSIEQGPYSRQELKMFSDLSARLSGVAALARMLGFAKAEAALDAFQASGSPALLTGRYGEILRTNAAAEKLLGTDLQIRKGRLVSTDRSASVAIETALHQLLCTQGRSSMAVVLRRQGARPVIAYPLLLPSLSRDFLAPARAIVLLVDLDRPVSHADDVLSSVFGLTLAEAKLASRLCCGESLQSAADALGIACVTARNQLKSVFTKTETRRQGELVALANRLLLPVSRP